MNRQLAAIVVLVLASCAHRPATERYRIVYNVHLAETKDYEIFSMAPDGSDVRNISNSPGTDWVYGACGDRLYFVSTRDTGGKGYNLYEMTADGGNVRRITSYKVPDSHVNGWDDCGELIVSIRKENDFDLYRIDREGVELRRLTTTAARDLDPAVSPDGTKVVFRSGDAGELWIMNIDGTGARQLTSHPAPESIGEQHLYRAGPPRWSPDGKQITYMSWRDGKYGLFAVDPSGSEPKRITATDIDAGYHHWAPDGSAIALDVKQEGNYDIFVMKPDGSGLKQLTRGGNNEQGPVFVRRSDSARGTSPTTTCDS
ncbi:MAG TPA: hypothetical protein VGQ36_00820 [Thermoanaerobaculia bacterium]|jgi:TolB protein|nr:hypothetical protein [Thermoanaerobaculia bacterium]